MINNPIPTWFMTSANSFLELMVSIACFKLIQIHGAHFVNDAAAITACPRLLSQTQSGLRPLPQLHPLIKNMVTSAIKKPRWQRLWRQTRGFITVVHKPVDDITGFSIHTFLGLERVCRDKWNDRGRTDRPRVHVTRATPAVCVLRGVSRETRRCLVSGFKGPCLRRPPGGRWMCPSFRSSVTLSHTKTHRHKGGLPIKCINKHARLEPFLFITLTWLLNTELPGEPPLLAKVQVDNNVHSFFF